METKTKLVVCCDGTSKSEYLSEKKSPLTNVSRISRAIHQFDGECRQIVLYLPGIGTDEGNRFNLLNQGLGVGLNSQIKEAYTFLRHNYRAEAKDDIILIGFSRGAFAVRCIIDLVLTKGLLYKNYLHLVPNLFQEWINSRERSPFGEEPEVPESQNKKFEVRKANIEVCALWDSVNAVGFPGTQLLGRGKPKMSFVDSVLPEGVKHAFQALSLFEHRFNFHPLVLRRRNGDNGELQQCWLPGYHSDIGGGNDKEALAQFALAWMIQKLKRFLSIEVSGFWYGRDSQVTWVLPDADDLKIPDPYYRFTGVAAGSSHRTPRLDFWNPQDIYHEDPRTLVQGLSDNGDFSQERMHPVVRCMFQQGWLKGHFSACQSLRNGSLEETRFNRWVWNLEAPPAVIQWMGRMGNIPSSALPYREKYNLWEDEFNEEEMTMLKGWAQNEHEKLLQSRLTEIGAEEPNTILVPFQVWVEKELERAAGFNQ
ncbi:hypothetical protein GQX73_g10426 [Xylaria multiplex]|uniref:T6SS Phospholipase effector Tle1-like catalytic domain-containing protein n=1 Tax=Xylaria multiplex TaxID=323545 RepID=A0A7C8IGV8_9PEZI|nr:hypothetical protein GQX73_g10426 [Xylaria multiplex]